LEPRYQPSAFTFNSGLPDGKMATISRPAAASNGNVEFESGDDFVLNSDTRLTQATFTGLLPSNAPLSNVQQVVVEIYRVFPKDSDTTRTPKVPTRQNSPSDVAFDSRDSATAGDLTFTDAILNGTFTANASVQTTNSIAVHSGGDGAVTGEEVQFTVNFAKPLDLPADHYFFVPQVLLSSGNFLWLSAPRPITGAGTTPFTPDLQSWMRDDPPLAPDWLRIGTDIIAGSPAPTFNASFALSGQTFTPQISSLSQTSAAEGSPGLTLTVNGSHFTSQSTVLFNGQALATTFVSASKLQAVLPSNLLADEATNAISVNNPAGDVSAAQTFTVTDNVPALNATISQGPSLQKVTISGQVGDQAFEGHKVRIKWGDGTVQTLDLGSGPGGSFSLSHKFKKQGPRRRIIVVTALDDEGTASAPVSFSVRVHR
jgi:hypothetical protein